MNTTTMKAPPAISAIPRTLPITPPTMAPVFEDLVEWELSPKTALLEVDIWELTTERTDSETEKEPECKLEEDKIEE